MEEQISFSSPEDATAKVNQKLYGKNADLNSPMVIISEKGLQFSNNPVYTGKVEKITSSDEGGAPTVRVVLAEANKGGYNYTEKTVTLAIKGRQDGTTETVCRISRKIIQIKGAGPITLDAPSTKDALENINNFFGLSGNYTLQVNTKGQLLLGGKNTGILLGNITRLSLSRDASDNPQAELIANNQKITLKFDGDYVTFERSGTTRSCGMPAVIGR